MIRCVAVRNMTSGGTLGDRIRVADRWWARLRGQLGRRQPAVGEGLLLIPCRAVHMFGLSYALDVAFVGREGAVVAVYHDLQPGARSGWHRGAACALELPPGTLARTETTVGDTIAWEAALTQP